MQATIYPIIPIDALVGGSIKFSWNGNQTFKNRCIIKNNDTNISVYNNIVETFKFEHVIDMKKAMLVNGVAYRAYITVFDVHGNESTIQQLGEPFYCLENPKFNFSNIVNGQVILSSNFDFELVYSQANRELLDSWVINIYTKSHSLISSSSISYDTDNLNYTFTGLTNKNEYYVRATGVTVNKIPLDTGYINFSVTYSTKDVFSLLEATNLPNIGAIQMSSNIIASEGHPDHNVIYIDGTKADLRNNIVKYTEGFKFSDDFSFVLVFSNVKPNHDISILSGTTIDVYLTYRICKHNSNDFVGAFELRVKQDEVAYIQYARFPLPLETDILGVCIVRKDGLYDLQIYNYGKGVNT